MVLYLPQQLSARKVPRRGTLKVVLFQVSASRGSVEHGSELDHQIQFDSITGDPLQQTPNLQSVADMNGAFPRC